MKVRNLSLIAIAFSVCSLSGIANAGTINFTGAVQDVSCDVNPGTGATGTANNITIDLGSVGKDGVANSSNTVSGMATTFADLEVSCADAGTLSKVKMKFDAHSGSGAESNRGLLDIANKGGSGVASGVGIAILDSKNTLIDLRDSTKYIEAPLSVSGTSATAKLSFKAAYMATGAKSAITAGSANGQLPFVLNYE
ncbi:MAG: type 1 fimbrial protein [Enterobacteriaceae bacterium]|jgi:type 1 fimbria pilin|nr:type 1 fimbrial protein [Enterobacteriaceae bacterium]